MGESHPTRRPSPRRAYSGRSAAGTEDLGKLVKSIPPLKPTGFSKNKDSFSPARIDKLLQKKSWIESMYRTKSEMAEKKAKEELAMQKQTIEVWTI